jgi:hypothetical protein
VPRIDAMVFTNRTTGTPGDLSNSLVDVVSSFLDFTFNVSLIKKLKISTVMRPKLPIIRVGSAYGQSRKNLI